MLCSLVGSDDNSMNFKLEVSDIARLVCLESDHFCLGVWVLQFV